ncbi:MAG: butyrate kinase [Lachnospiraceae bacterium]|nr:butyrate kinase [Lachnospiraceae bacterium]
MAKQIVVINPGSTSTKIALYMDAEQVFSKNLDHSAEELSHFPEIADQLDFRKEVILKALEAENVDIRKTDAFAGRCTGLLPMPGGVYEVNDLMFQHASIGIGSRHAGNLGPMIAKDFAEEFGGRAFCVNPSSVDEFILDARLTGLKDEFRTSRGHPLNQKEVARHYALDEGKDYNDVNVIVVHMGGGISIGAHQKGKIIDNVDSTRGEGRMAPTRTGTIPAADLVEICFSGKYTRIQLLDKIMKTGGWVDHLGTSDGIEVGERIKNGDKYAEIVFNATAYQIAKDIGAMAAAMDGEVDAILLTGGLAYSKPLVELIERKVSFIAPIRLYPGEFEMEGLAAGALRVLEGLEEPKSYTGEPVFKGFDELIKE